MKTLIVEDDFTSRLVLQELLKEYGHAHIAINGREAVDAVKKALKDNANYDLICMDIMMPEMDGQQALTEIRETEEKHGILSSDGAKVIMTTALGDLDNVISAYSSLCDGYLVKPIEALELKEQLDKLDLTT